MMTKKIKDLKLNFLFQIILVFSVMSSLSLATANNMITGNVVYTSEPVQSVYVPPSPAPPYHPAQVDIFQFLVSFFLATSLMLVFMRLFKGKLLLEIFFAGAIVFGAQGPLGIIFTKLVAFIASIAVIVLRFIYPRIWTQNLAIILGISGIAASLGLSSTPAVAIAFLAVLSIYDIIAVCKTRHMVELFKGMAKRGVVLALAIPGSFLLWLDKFESITAENKDEYIFLGAGDLALPLFFAMSVFPVGIKFSVLIILGAILGFTADHVIFMSQKEKKPIPALPAIALFSIAGYIAAAYL